MDTEYEYKLRELHMKVYCRRNNRSRMVERWRIDSYRVEGKRLQEIGMFLATFPYAVTETILKNLGNFLLMEQQEARAAYYHGFSLSLKSHGDHVEQA